MTLRDLLVISGLCALTEDADEAIRLSLTKEVVHLFGEDAYERMDAIEASNEETVEVMLQILRSLAVDQELLDMKAGIPARDAEIEALRKEIEALQAAPVKPYSLDLDPAGIRALAADAISGALALGYQGVNPPPNNEHWLAPFWEIGRESAAQAQPLDVQPIEITDSMALAFHNAITDGSVGQEDVDDIKTGLRAVCANILDMRPQAQQPVSGADQFRDAAQMIEPSGNAGELPSDDWLAGCVGVQNQGGLLQITGLADIRRFAECVLKHWGKQDADKVDAERWRAYRSSVAADDAGFLQRALNAFEAMGIEDGKVPSKDQIDAAIDAARKEQA